MRKGNSLAIEIVAIKRSKTNTKNLVVTAAFLAADDSSSITMEHVVREHTKINIPIF